MIEDIKSKLDEYLEFDSDILFINKYNLVRIFGGAIRDSIANQPINDIDIIVGSKALKEIEFLLENKGYHYMEMLNGKDLQEMYSEIHIINEPHTWIKGKKIVQLIRPSFGFEGKDESFYRKGFSDLISNVDFSCCGVSYDGEKVYENYESAVSHCKNGIFIVNNRAKMYSERRITHRKVKLTSRGWVEVKPDAATYRDLKIDKILSEEIIDYVSEYEDDLPF